MAAKLGPMETVIVSKFIKTLGVVEGIPTGSQQAQTHKKESGKAPSNAFKTGKELMYGRQGKNMYNNNLTTDVSHLEMYCIYVLLARPA
jgi:hypothetical protein